MKIPFIIFACVFSPIYAQVIGVDDFSYANGSIAGESGGTGFNYDNFDQTSTSSSSDWDVLFGSPTIVNGALTTDGDGAIREYNGPLEGAGNSSNNGQDDHERSGAVRGMGQIFYRCSIQRFNSATWSGLSSYDFSTERVFFGVPAQENPESDELEFGIEILGANTRYYSGIAADTNPHELIFLLDFDRDLIALWLDPDSFDFYDATTGEHTADAFGPYTPNNWSTAIRLASSGEVSWDNLTISLDSDGVGLADGIEDLDSDGLPGNWEAANGLDDNDDGSIDPNNGFAGDPDGDGLINLNEFLLGTDPQESDFDNDGFDDGFEFVAGTNPFSPSSFPGANPPPDLIGVEEFDYPKGTIAGRSGGQHWDRDNASADDQTLGHTGTNSDWNATGGNPQVVLGKLITQSNSALREYNSPGEGDQILSDEREGAIGGNSFFESNVIYYRCELTRRSGVTWSGLSAFDFDTELFLFGVPNAPNPSSGNREFAIHDLLEDSHAYSGIQPVTDQTYTMVAKLDYSNELACLYLDPDLSQAESTQTPIATMTNIADDWTSALRLASGSGGSAEWDQLRVAVTWEGLTEAPPSANDDSVEIFPGGQSRIKVIANDGGEFLPSTISIINPPAFGNATPSPDGTVLYQHTAGAPTSDSFTYRITNQNGNLSDTATATVLFTNSARFDTSFVNMPENPPAIDLVLEEAFEGLDFDFPHDFCTVPNDSEKLFVSEGDGRIYLVPDVAAAVPTRLLILDITSQVEHDINELAMKGIAVHPDWANNGFIYVTYNTTADTARLSRFTCQTSAPFTAGSELILIDQANPDDIHNISTCQFGSDGYLYVGFGDGGSQEDRFNNSQHIDRNLWSCLIRIDVDKRAGNLEPNPDSDIPRDGNGNAYFSIPADNPFVSVTSFNGINLNATEVRTEIYVMGLRNPWQFSPEDNNQDGIVDEVWIGDVGRADREEVGIYTAGQNGGWAWREGSEAGVRSGDLINGASEAAATLTEPLWDYGHGGSIFEGTSITGGFVYRESTLPSLTGKYICADYISGNIWSIERGATAQSPPTITRLTGQERIVALTTDPATGDVLLLSRNDGTIKRLTLGSTSSVDGAGFPQTLSQTNFSSDPETLLANPGGIAYEPNLTFWSDFAEKSRWFLLNNTADTIAFSQDDPWDYPAGMVWVKHFDYPAEWETFPRIINGQSITDRRPVVDSPRRKVETRFLVRNTEGVYGVSYQWTNLNGGPQFDASLAGNNGETFDIEITLDGSPTTVPWEIPSRSSCLTCHTSEAGHSLSFNTRQLNAPGSLAGSSDNFLNLLNDSGYLTGLTDSPANLPRHLHPAETTYSLEARVRSYLDVNCAYCHQSGGTGGGDWDGRSHLTLNETGIINGIPVDAPLDPNDLLVIPGLVDDSLIYNRAAAANGYSRMPPLATNEIDLEGVQLITDWINNEARSELTYEDWRLLQFGNISSPEGEPRANPDGDFADNFYEWLTNTNPNDPASNWQPELSIDHGDVEWSFQGLGNRSVTILRSEDLQIWDLWSAPGNDGIPLNPSIFHTFSSSITEEEFFQFRIEER